MVKTSRRELKPAESHRYIRCISIHMLLSVSNGRMCGEVRSLTICSDDESMSYDKPWWRWIPHCRTSSRTDSSHCLSCLSACLSGNRPFLQFLLQSSLTVMRQLQLSLMLFLSDWCVWSIHLQRLGLASLQHFANSGCLPRNQGQALPFCLETWDRICRMGQSAYNEHPYLCCRKGDTCRWNRLR